MKSPASQLFRQAQGSLAACMLMLCSSASPQVLPDKSPDKSLGVVSCASSLCHGSIASWNGSPIAQNEYVVWSRLDKHAGAYKLLLGEKSRKIAANLALPQPAHQSRVCLDCHSHNPVAAAAPTHSVADGVGCEACHGAASRWIASHTEPGATHRANLANGLYPSDQPLARARLCLSCHFGTADKYVTHRMMAAGHPRMSFELGTFTSLQPAHFKADADYVRRKGVVEGAGVWAVGQALAVSSQLDMLLDPKRRRDGAFPELTLFDCHACHHPMADARWKPRNTFGKSIGPGLVRLNGSSMQMLSLILRLTDPALGERFIQAAGQLNQAVAGSGDVTQRALALKALADEAARKIAGSGLTDDQLRAMALALVDEGLAGAYADYAAAEQAVMALGNVVNVLHRTGRLNATLALNKGLAALRASLLHDEAYKPAEFQARLREFRPLVAAPPGARPRGAS